MPQPIHLLTGHGQLHAAAVACGARDAALGSFDLTQVTCPACQRQCTCGPGVPLCPADRAWNAAHRGRPTTAPPALRTEKQFQGWLLKQAAAAGFLSYHTWDARRSAAGYPDATLVHPGRGLLLFAELKMPGKQPTPAQQLWLDALAQVQTVSTHLWYPDDWPAIEESLR
jgi:hypothetical protein